MSDTSKDPTHKQRASHLRWVKISSIIPSRQAQREYRPTYAAELAGRFNLEGMGFPVLSLRDGTYYCIDGQHRLGALRDHLGFAEDAVQCEVYEGLSEAEEAELFLERNAGKAVNAWDKFRVGINAGRPEEVEIERLVLAQGLKVSGRHNSPGVISAVNTLRTIFRRQGAGGLSRTLVVIRDSYGDSGFDAPILDGIGLFLHRYDGQVDDPRLIHSLGNASGGLNAVTIPAQKYHTTLGYPKAQCIAAAITDIYNRSRGGGKLPAWWKA